MTIRGSTRKVRVDSKASVQKIMQGSVVEVTPPAHVPLEDQDWPFWENVVAEFARAAWTEHQLELAAMLARTLSNLESQQRELRKEGFVAASPRGTPVVNPRSLVVKSLTGDILSLRRSLALHARGKTGDNRHAGNQNEIAKEVERKTKAVIGQDGIARPA